MILITKRNSGLDSLQQQKKKSFTMTKAFSLSSHYNRQKKKKSSGKRKKKTINLMEIFFYFFIYIIVAVSCMNFLFFFTNNNVWYFHFSLDFIEKESKQRINRLACRPAGCIAFERKKKKSFWEKIIERPTTTELAVHTDSTLICPFVCFRCNHIYSSSPV